MFEPGVKVVCVNDTFLPSVARLYEQLPKKGKTYIVRDIVPGQDIDCKETVTVYLEEIRNATNNPSHTTPGLKAMERGFACHRFIELEEVKENKVNKINKQQPVLV